MVDGFVMVLVLAGTSLVGAMLFGSWADRMLAPDSPERRLARRTSREADEPTQIIEPEPVVDEGLAREVVMKVLTRGEYLGERLIVSRERPDLFSISIDQEPVLPARSLEDLRERVLAWQEHLKTQPASPLRVVGPSLRPAIPRQVRPMSMNNGSSSPSA